MTDQRFAELLNLHLDHEATPSQAAEFAAEIARSSVRRSEYHSYLRMHHACGHLFTREESLAPASFALEKARLEAERKTSALEHTAVRRPIAVAIAGLAAVAAGVALIFVRPAFTPAPSSTASVVAPTPSARTHPPAAFIAALPSSRSAPPGLTRVELTELVPALELPSIHPVDTGDFSGQPPLSLTVQQIMAISRSTGAQPQAAQTAAFQFQR